MYIFMAVMSRCLCQQNAYLFVHVYTFTEIYYVYMDLFLCLGVFYVSITYTHLIERQTSDKAYVSTNKLLNIKACKYVCMSQHAYVITMVPSTQVFSSSSL